MAIGDKHGVLMDFDKGVPFEVATLDANGKLAEAQRPSAAEMGASNPNLLDNWLFTAESLIDQKQGYVVPPGTNYYDAIGGTVIGQTENYLTASPVSGVTSRSIVVDGVTRYVSPNDIVRGYTGLMYGEDRWIGRGNVTTLNDSECLRLIIPEGATSEIGFYQILEKPEGLEGKLVTFSVFDLSKNDVFFVTCTLPEITSQNQNFVIENFGNYLLHISSVGNSAGRKLLCCCISIVQPEARILAAKLELGSVQTLARKDAAGNLQLIDPPPNPAEELAKCQRYLLPVDMYAGGGGNYDAGASNNVYFFIPTPAPMRNTPSLVGVPDTMTLMFRTISGQVSRTISASQLSVFRYTPSHVELRVALTEPLGDAVKGTPLWVYATPSGTKFYLDANL